MTAHAENFVALSAKPTELAENLLQLKETKPELFKYFDDLLQQADKQLVQGDLFSQRANESADMQPDNFVALVERTVKEQFSGDRNKWPEAMKIAEQARPDLARDYLKKGV